MSGTAPQFSKAKVDRLGERLRSNEIAPDDLRSLDEYRRSFSGPYEHVVSAMQAELNLKPTGRPAKSTTSIRDKLKRESIRLSQMQDIAGCRIIVADVMAQDSTVEALVSRFENVRIFDRRESSSHGYRAVHIIVHHEGKPIEIQVRSDLQQMWAELSEKAADVVDPAIKYGGGPTEWNERLIGLSAAVGAHEANQARFAALKERARTSSNLQPQAADLMNSLETALAKSNAQFRNFLRKMSADITKEGELRNAVLD